MCTFRLATNDVGYTKENEKFQRTEWHNIICWGSYANKYANEIKKGKLMYIEGKLQTRKYEEEGKNKFYTEIVAKEIGFLEPRKYENDIQEMDNDEIECERDNPDKEN